MSIIKLVWRTMILLVCSLIQIVGVLIEGIARILVRLTKMLERAHDRILDYGVPKKKVKQTNIDVAL